MHTQSSEEVDTDAPERREYSVMVGRFDCRLIDETLTEDRSWRSDLRLLLPFEFFDTYTNESAWPSIEMPEGVSLVYPQVRVDVVSAEGDVLFSSRDGFYFLSYAFKAYTKQLKADQLRAEIGELRRRFELLPLEKKPSTHPVRKMFYLVDQYAERYTWSWMGGNDHARALELFQQIRRAIDDLESSDAVEVAIEQLMSGQWSSTVHHRNLSTVAAINAASVRTGGFIDTFDEEQMREFYRHKLAGLSNPLSYLDDAKLLLVLEDYAPEDVLDDPDVEAAPLQIQLLGNKGEVAYDVTYRHVDGEPTAIVQLPLKVYQRYAPEYGKECGLSELPHDIVWAVEIVFEGKVVISGKADLDLNDKIKKWSRGRKRAKHADDALGSMLYGADRGEVPPWYVGKAKPGRRR